MTKDYSVIINSALGAMRNLSSPNGINVGSELHGTDCGFDLTFFVSVCHECKPFVNLACDVLADKIITAVFELCDDFNDYFESPSEEVPGDA